MFCNVCGKENREHSGYCNQCGAKLISASSPVKFGVSAKGKNKGILLLTCGLIIIFLSCVWFIKSAEGITDAFSNLISDNWQPENFFTAFMIAIIITLIINGIAISGLGLQIRKRNICVAQDKLYCNFFKRLDDKTIEIPYKEIINIQCDGECIMVKTVKEDYKFHDIQSANECTMLIRSKII